jgi:hypothetical protein
MERNIAPRETLVPDVRRREMAEDLKKGDKVKWKSHGGQAHGTVEKKQTSETHIKGHKVAASKDNPQFIVKTHDGKKAAHKKEALTRE